MPRWEVASISLQTIRKWETPGEGMFAVKVDREFKAWVAERMSVSGGSEAIAQSTGWDGHWNRGHDYWDHDRDQPPRQLRELIAQLGMDGWEPMPLVMVGGGSSVHSDVEWYFKRQMPG